VPGPFGAWQAQHPASPPWVATHSLDWLLNSQQERQIPSPHRSVPDGQTQVSPLQTLSSEQEQLPLQPSLPQVLPSHQGEQQSAGATQPAPGQQIWPGRQHSPDSAHHSWADGQQSSPA